jgi:hypothetical protein
MLAVPRRDGREVSNLRAWGRRRGRITRLEAQAAGSSARARDQRRRQRRDTDQQQESLRWGDDLVLVVQRHADEASGGARDEANPGFDAGTPQDRMHIRGHEDSPCGDELLGTLVGRVALRGEVEHEHQREADCRAQGLQDEAGVGEREPAGRAGGRADWSRQVGGCGKRPIVIARIGPS